MEDHIFKLVEVTGTSTQSQDDAIRNAIAKASESVRNMRWFTVTETRGAIEEGAIAHWQVTVKIGFRIE